MVTVKLLHVMGEGLLLVVVVGGGGGVFRAKNPAQTPTEQKYKKNPFAGQSRHWQCYHTSVL
jgi:hypothetical protein